MYCLKAPRKTNTLCCSLQFRHVALCPNTAVTALCPSQPPELGARVCRLKQHLERRWRPVPAARLSALDCPRRTRPHVEALYTKLQAEFLIDHPLYWMYIRHLNSVSGGETR